MTMKIRKKLKEINLLPIVKQIKKRRILGILSFHINAQKQYDLDQPKDKPYPAKGTYPAQVIDT